ncbi:MAG: hypothetical protein AAGU19_15905 [Prolixibacteraceae bacterium]
MNNFTIQLYRIIVPKYFRRKIQAKRLPVSIFRYYKNHPEALSPEIESVLNYLKTNTIAIFPYSFQHDYHQEDVEVYDDAETGLRYVLLDGKRLYFKRRWGKKKIQKLHNILLKEQDIQSPHRYLSEQFRFNEGDLLIDAGVAEGNFALTVVEKASKLILFEPDREWLEPLEVTFAPWKDKVVIVNKFIGDLNGPMHTTLDELVSPVGTGMFIKADVEGAELSLLKGATKILTQQRDLKIAICTYHREKDEKELTEFLSQYKFEISPSAGYMLPIFDKKMKAPFFRRGLIRAKK